MIGFDDMTLATCAHLYTLKTFRLTTCVCSRLTVPDRKVAISQDRRRPFDKKRRQQRRRHLCCCRPKPTHELCFRGFQTGTGCHLTKQGNMTNPVILLVVESSFTVHPPGWSLAHVKQFGRQISLSSVGVLGINVVSCGAEVVLYIAIGF